MKKGREVQLIRSGIYNFVKNTIPAKELFLIKLRKGWFDIVGKGIAIHSYPNSVRNGVLTVNVDDPIWIQELTLQRDMIKESIINYLQNENFRKYCETLRFKNGEIKTSEEIKKERDSNLSIDKEILKKIDLTIKGVADKELKDSLRKYFIKINLKAQN